MEKEETLKDIDRALKLLKDAIYSTTAYIVVKNTLDMEVKT